MPRVNHEEIQMTQTKTVQEETIHGSIEYEVVECASCESEIAKEDAYEFKMVDDDRGGIFHSHVERKGYACEYCAHEGPISYPAITLDNYLTAAFKVLLGDNRLGGIDPFKVAVWFFMLMAVLLAGVIFL